MNQNRKATEAELGKKVRRRSGRGLESQDHTVRLEECRELKLLQNHCLAVWLCSQCAGFPCHCHPGAVLSKSWIKTWLSVTRKQREEKQ